MPVTLNPESLDVLKRSLGIVPSTGEGVSQDVLENDPELTLDTPHTAYEAGANEKMKNLLGLGPSPEMLKQQADMDAMNEAINKARIAKNPEVAAEADQQQQEKLALAHAQPGGLEVEAAKAKAAADAEQKTRDFQSQFLAAPQNAAVANSGITFKPNFNAEGKMSLTGEMPPKLTNAEQAQLDAAHSMATLGMPLLSEFEQKYPGIAQDPSKYGSISDALTEHFGKGIYSFGGMTSDDPLFQKTAAIQAWGMRQLAQGRINKSMMDIINTHLPQPGYSPGANYDRLHRLLTEVMPSLIGGIGSTKAGVEGQYSQDPWSTPPTAQEMAGR